LQALYGDCIQKQTNGVVGDEDLNFTERNAF